MTQVMPALDAAPPAVLDEIHPADLAATARSTAITSAVIVVGTCVLAWLSLFFVDSTTQIAAIWPANGLTMALLMISRSRKAWPAYLASMAVGLLAANLLSSE